MLSLSESKCPELVASYKVRSQFFEMMGNGFRTRADFLLSLFDYVHIVFDSCGLFMFSMEARVWSHVRRKSIKFEKPFMNDFLGIRISAYIVLDCKVSRSAKFFAKIVILLIESFTARFPNEALYWIEMKFLNTLL